MAFGKIYDTTYFGFGALDNTVGWGNIYKDLIDPTSASEILAEDGSYLRTENNDYIIIE